MQHTVVCTSLQSLNSDPRAICNLVICDCMVVHVLRIRKTVWAHYTILRLTCNLEIA